MSASDPVTTRDLVALAAKAMGHTQAIVYENEIGQPFAKVAKHQYFNPFDVPGDALELSCHLSMTIDYTSDWIHNQVVVRARANDKHYCCTQAYYPKTKLAMTMYAITYVAACIGEEMP